jgi:hypothetical protein
MVDEVEAAVGRKNASCIEVSVKVVMRLTESKTGRCDIETFRDPLD